jgi:hypothetical protein
MLRLVNFVPAAPGRRVHVGGAGGHSALSRWNRGPRVPNTALAGIPHRLTIQCIDVK